MKRKILTFIVNDGKFLALEMTKHPKHAPQGGWFVVTGGVEENESSEDAVAREVSEKRVREKELDNVHFRKPIPPWKVPGLIRASDVYFVGERDFYVEKHFSRKPMEALACQTPLIVSPEVKRKGIYIPLQHGIHCLEIYPRNTDELVEGIEKLLDDKNYAESMAKKGYEFALEKNQRFQEYITGLETFLKNISHKEK